MKNGRKSIRHYVFFSNAFMVVLTLGIFLVVYAISIKVYGYLERSRVVSESELSSGSVMAGEALQNRDWSSPEDGADLDRLGEELDRYGFYTAIFIDGEPVFSNMEDMQSDDLEEYEYFLRADSQSHIYMIDKITLITFCDAGTGTVVYAIDREALEQTPTAQTISLFILFCLASVAFFVLILCGVSFFFANRLTSHIMEPIRLLIRASENMKKGDYSDHIDYEGEWEFEHVCDSFNEMQRNIYENEQRKNAYEKTRIDMVAGISHDLRTPLTAIRGTIKGLRDGVAKTSQMQEKFLDTAYRRTLEMDHLLEQLFYLSKMETGNMPLQSKVVEWNRFLTDYREKQQNTGVDNTVTYDLFGKKERLCSLVDEHEIERAFDNIVENSRKYAGVEPLMITFRLKRKGDCAVITIADNGHGVPDEKIAYIFDEFYRADESRNQTEGNGLGLHIVKYLVEAMGGTVEAKNQQGLQIQMTFPIVEEA
ncbi:MAG: HAMP domain-containing histidine kinase [Clostridiales bacterium]|nr:HAMP domain-containing histidine kinase [Clostridiales bacterium]